MPKGKVPRFKKIHCRVRGCNRYIAVFDREKFSGYHVPADKILAATARHRKKYHPTLFKKSVKKSVATRKANMRGRK